MQSVLTVLRAAHCRSTHHYFAIDSLKRLKTAQAQRLANILLKYHDDYLIGAKAPDTSFKDYQNHVIHVQQNNWGGAAIKCQEWLDEARQALDQGKWKKAAYACGVLSHYFTDPIMPLHTAQSPREVVVHRPMEWSICQAYDKILQRVDHDGLQVDVTLAFDDHWISKAVQAAASVANRHYDRLIEIYDLQRGVANPIEGLNDEACEILAELFSLAIGGFAAVLTRLADEATVQLPQVSLTMTSLLATIDMPLAWIVKRVSDYQERRKVQAILKEYETTGTLKRNMPPEISVVEKARFEQPDLRFTAPPEVSPHSQTIGKGESDNQALAEDSNRSPSAAAVEQRIEATKTPSDASTGTNTRTEEVTSIEISRAERADQAIAEVLQSDSIAPPETHDAAWETHSQYVSLTQARNNLRLYRPDSSPESESSKVNESIASEVKRAESLETEQTSHDSRSTDRETTAASSQPVPARESELHPSNSPTLRIAPETAGPKSDEKPGKVTYGSPLVDAPSIGPKTAKRFENIGIRTIRQFVNSNADELAEGLATRWITEELIRQWQDQARLVCEVPALTGYRAQLLVAVGCRTSWHLRTYNSAALHSQISQFCETSEGQQILRSASVPSMDDIAIWVESAKQYARRSVA